MFSVRLLAAALLVTPLARPASAADADAPAAAGGKVEFTLDQPAVTSAGVYDADGRLVGGARIAKWAADGDRFKLAWEQFGCEFVSLGNCGVHDPDTLYSTTFHRYALKDRAAGAWEYTGCVNPYNLSRDDRPYYGDAHGVPRVIKLAGGEFLFLPTGD